jgi:DNA/RNA-binding domain of Phe-tRNA-synthetase-like protein
VRAEDDDLAPGWVDREVAAEFPGLQPWTAPPVALPSGGRSPAPLRARLRALADRVHGAEARLLRQRPIPHAYRVFFRHIGLDPDVHRIPVEALVVRRLTAGGLPSEHLVADALTVAVLETAVPVWALDADAVDGPLGIRAAAEAEPLGAGGPPLPAGRLVVADAAGPLAVLFGEAAPGRAAAPGTRRALLFSVGVAGVPEVHVAEALWIARDILSGEGD